MSAEKKCQQCGRPGATMWTINNGGEVAIVELCDKCAAPILTLIRPGSISGPPSPPERKRNGPLAPRRVEKEKLFEPLDWVPPRQ